MAYLTKKSTVQIELTDITDRLIVATVSENEATYLRDELNAVYPPAPKSNQASLGPDVINPLLSKRALGYVNAHLAARNGKKIDAIRFLREVTSSGLKDAKDAIEHHIANIDNKMPPISFQDQSLTVQKYISHLSATQNLIDVIDSIPF